MGWFTRLFHRHDFGANQCVLGFCQERNLGNAVSWFRVCSTCGQKKCSACGSSTWRAFPVILIAAMTLAATEVKFYEPVAHAVIRGGDAFAVYLNAPRIVKNPGRYWSLVLIKNPYSMFETAQEVTDTVRLANDTNIQWATTLTAPMPDNKDETYCLGLVYHPSMMVYKSDIFTISRVPASGVLKNARNPKTQVAPALKLGYTVNGRKL